MTVMTKVMDQVDGLNGDGGDGQGNIQYIIYIMVISDLYFRHYHGHAKYLSDDVQRHCCVGFCV